MSDREKMGVMIEFIDPIATVALNLPYVIRSRFVYVTTHLCHQANRARETTHWRDDLPLDNDIYLGVADKYGAGWRGYKRVKSRMEKIAARRYQEATRDFRNAYNHRIAPRVVLGVTGSVVRKVESATGRVSYVFGASQPLKLDQVASLLTEQCGYSYAAFEAFQRLITEHEASITGYESNEAKAQIARA